MNSCVDSLALMVNIPQAKLSPEWGESRRV